MELFVAPGWGQDTALSDPAPQPAQTADRLRQYVLTWLTARSAYTLTFDQPRANGHPPLYLCWCLRAEDLALVPADQYAGSVSVYLLLGAPSPPQHRQCADEEARAYWHAKVHYPALVRLAANSFYGYRLERFGQALHARLQSTA